MRSLKHLLNVSEQPCYRAGCKTSVLLILRAYVVGHAVGCSHVSALRNLQKENCDAHQLRPSIRLLITSFHSSIHSSVHPSSRPQSVARSANHSSQSFPLCRRHLQFNWLGYQLKTLMKCYRIRRVHYFYLDFTSESRTKSSNV